MRMRHGRRRTAARLAALVLLTVLVLGFRGRGTPQTSAPEPLPDAVRSLAPGWTLKVQRRFSENVTSLVVTSPEIADEHHLDGVVFVGTGGIRGTVHRYQSRSPRGSTLIGEGLGDHLDFGRCAVNHLAVRDIDRDGTPELLAQTCQIDPLGRPRLYIWDIEFPPVLRGMVRPEIGSSFSHGMAFFPPAGSSDMSSAPSRIFSTFCGRGEIVEYRLDQGSSRGGFQRDSINWRLAGQLPSSGEQAESADLDRDGVPELVLAAGFDAHRAAIHVLSPGTGRDHAMKTRFVVDEGRRFGNVRFLIGDLVGDGSREMIAWWCLDTAGGPSEVVRYRFGPEGILDRNLLGVGPGLWCDDGQAVLADADGRGRPLVWFAARDGGLWTYDPTGPARLDRVACLAGSVGPLSPMPRGSGSGLLIGWGKAVVELRRDETAPVSNSNSGPIAASMR